MSPSCCLYCWLRPDPPCQVEVIAAVVAAGTYKAAAARLGLRPGTVRNHLMAPRSRLGVETTTRAVYVLTARGLPVVPSVGRSAA